jgi:hypothetical protein
LYQEREVLRLYIYCQEEKDSTDGQGCLIFLPVAAEILLVHKKLSWQVAKASSLMSHHVTQISGHQAKGNGGKKCARNHNYTYLNTGGLQIETQEL